MSEDKYICGEGKAEIFMKPGDLAKISEHQEELSRELKKLLNKRKHDLWPFNGYSNNETVQAYLDAMKYEVDAFIEKARNNKDNVCTVGMICFDVPKKLSVEVFEKLREEGYNVSTFGEQFGNVRLQVMIKT